MGETTVVETSCRRNDMVSLFGCFVKSSESQVSIHICPRWNSFFLVQNSNFFKSSFAFERNSVGTFRLSFHDLGRNLKMQNHLEAKQNFSIDNSWRKIESPKKLFYSLLYVRPPGECLLIKIAINKNYCSIKFCIVWIAIQICKSFKSCINRNHMEESNALLRPNFMSFARL